MFVNNLFQFYWYFYEYFPNFNPNSKVLPTLAFRLKYSLCCASWLAILALYFPNINTPLAMYCSISAQFLGNMAKTQIFLLQNPLENDWYVPLIFLAFFLYLSTNCELLLFILFRKINSWGNECFVFTLFYDFFFFRWTLTESLIWVQLKDVAARHLQIIVATSQIHWKGFLYFTFYNIYSLEKRLLKKGI